MQPRAPSVDLPQRQGPPLDFQQEALTQSTSLFGFTGKAFTQNIAAHKIAVVVNGARQIGLPAIGRHSAYEGCQIVVFENAVPDVGIQAKRQDRLAMEVIEKNRVARIDTDFKWGEKDQTFSVWYAKPKPTILIAATDVRFLQTMLREWHGRRNRARRYSIFPSGNT